MTSDITTKECQTELRPLHSELGILTRPDGSALVCQGDTAVVAAVYGPLEAKPQRMSIEKACVEAHYRPKAGVPGVSDRLKESFIRNTCETALQVTLYPRTVVSIIIQEMQDSGGLISCAVNSACLALLNSGIEMKFLVGAVSCMLDEMDNIKVDPCRLDLERAKATFTFVFDSIQGNIMASHTTGIFTEDQYLIGVQKCRSASSFLFSYYKSTVSKLHTF